MQQPDLSVLIPTYGRTATIARLLARLCDQSLDPSRFEVVVVDDGSPEPIALDAASYPFHLTLLRQENAGPGAARNAGVAHCRASWTVILNDDAVPASDLLERHLARSREVGPKVAVLGTCRFTAEAAKSPFVQVLASSDLLFDFPRLKSGQFHGWSFFWTCNLGLPTQTLRDNPFDSANFREAIVEDYLESGRRQPPEVLAERLLAMSEVRPSAREMGAIVTIASVRPEFLDTALRTAERTHGSLAGWLDANGVDAATRAALAEALLA